MALQPKTRKWIFYSILAVFGVSVMGGFFANRWVKTKGYSNLWEFITSTSSNYSKSFSAEYEILNIHIDDKDFAKLEAQRERALQRGIMVNEEDSYVNAVLEHNGKQIRSELRLKGHMTDHLQENKWSFRVKTKKGDAFMGMKRFSLQHPGTRNYVHEWIYHRMMESEGIVALRYVYLKVKVNHKDWGIYALEEHFGQELIENNDRMKGPVLRYNPELYWIYRINELHDIHIVEEYAQMQSSYYEPYDTKNILGDTSLRTLYVDAMNRLEAFRRGELRTSQVFDIEKLAAFHAIIDVVGGHHSLDWSDVKYYYNRETQLLEPVAYESFSVRNTDRIAGSYRFSGDTTTYINNHHNALFNDTAFFAAYIRALDRIADKKWLDNFFHTIDPALQNNLAVLYKEFAYKKYDNKGYYKNAENIKAILKSPKGFYAHVESFGQDTLHLAVGGIESLPSVIYALHIDTLRIEIKPAFVVPAKMTNRYISYRQLKIALPEGVQALPENKFKLEYALPGRTETKLQKIFEYPAHSLEKASKAYLRREANDQQFSFLMRDEHSKTIYFAQGQHILDKDLVLPRGYRIVAREHTRLVLNNKAKIISYSPLDFRGTEDAPVVIESRDSSGQGLVVLAAKANSEFSFVVFRGLAHPEEGDFSHPAALNLYESPAKFSDCEFLSLSAAGFHSVRSAVIMTRCYFSDISGDALRMYFGNYRLSQLAFSTIGDEGINLNNCYGELTHTRFSKVKGKAIALSDYSGMKGNGIAIDECKTGIESMNASDVVLQKVSIRNCKLALRSGSKGGVFGPASIVLKSAEFIGNMMQEEVEKGSTIRMEEK